MTRPEEKQEPGQTPLWAGDDEQEFFDNECEDEEEELGEEVHTDCRCGDCCRHLIIEVNLEDAQREPKIRERGSPIYTHPELTRSGKRELEGYLLNDPQKGNACTFLDQTTSLCSIHDTRPWVCRVFDCDGKDREELIQLGILPGRSQSR
jgi:Fe-S-cluster containining protein